MLEINGSKETEFDKSEERDSFETFLDKFYEKNSFDAAIIDMLATRSIVNSRNSLLRS